MKLPVLLCAVALAAAFLFPTQAEAVQCGGNEYPVLQSDGYEYCMDWADPPAPVFLNCFRNFRGYTCKAFPRTVDANLPLKYKWEGGGNINGGSTAWTTAYSRSVVCGDGTPNWVGFITVTVRSPYFLEASTSQGLNCQVDYTF